MLVSKGKTYARGYASAAGADVEDAWRGRRDKVDSSIYHPFRFGTRDEYAGSDMEGMSAEEGCAGDVLQWLGIKKTGHRLLQSQGVGIGEMLRGSAENVGSRQHRQGR